MFRSTRAKSDLSVCAHRRSCSLIWNAIVELHVRCSLDEKRSLMRLPRVFLHGSAVAVPDCVSAVAVDGDCCDGCFGHCDGCSWHCCDSMCSSRFRRRIECRCRSLFRLRPVATPLALRAFNPFPFFCSVFFGEAAFLDWPSGVFFSACLTCTVSEKVRI
jgi:hypothetical protein